MTVGELGRRMSSAEFGEWMAYYQLEPFGPLRDDRRAGEVAAMVANVNRDRKHRREPFTWLDFFPLHDAAPARPVSIFDKLQAWADAHNAAYYARDPKAD